MCIFFQQKNLQCIMFAYTCKEKPGTFSYTLITTIIQVKTSSFFKPYVYVDIKLFVVTINFIYLTFCVYFVY